VESQKKEAVQKVW